MSWTEAFSLSPVGTEELMQGSDGAIKIRLRQSALAAFERRDGS